MGVGQLLLEHLDVAGDARQRRVDLVGDAGRKQADRGQLLRGQELLLEADLVGDVLEDDDRPVGLEGVVEKGRACDVEDLLPAGRLQRDLAQKPEVRLAFIGEQGAVGSRAKDVLEATAEGGLLPDAHLLLEDPVPADDEARLVDDGDAHRQALDDVLAIVLESLHLHGPDGLAAVEVGILQGQSGRAGDRRQQLPILPGEGGPVELLAHSQAADDLVFDLEREDVEEPGGGELFHGRPGGLGFGSRGEAEPIPLPERPRQPIVEDDPAGELRALALGLEDLEGAPVVLVGQEEGQPLQVERVGDGLEERVGELLQIPFAAEIAGDGQEGLPVLVAPFIDGPIDQALEHPFERGEQGRAENDGQGAEDDGVEPVLREKTGPGTDDEIDEGEDEEREGQGRRFLEEDLDIDQPVARDGIGKNEGDEGLEQDRQLGPRGRPAPGDERDDVKDGRGENAEPEPVDDDTKLPLDQDVRGPAGAVGQDGQRDQGEHDEMEEFEPLEAVLGAKEDHVAPWTGEGDVHPDTGEEQELRRRVEDENSVGMVLQEALP